MLKNKIIQIIRETIEEEQVFIDLDTTLEEDLGVDSFTSLMILRAVEDEFEISVDDEFIVGLKTVRDIVEAISQRLNNEEKSP